MNKKKRERKVREQNKGDKIRFLSRKRIIKKNREKYLKEKEKEKERIRLMLLA